MISKRSEKSPAGSGTTTLCWALSWVRTPTSAGCATSFDSGCWCGRLGDLHGGAAETSEATAGNLLLPCEGARIGPTTFDEWFMG